MRRCYLVCYDIRDSKRLRKVYRVMGGYGESWQYSVFFCVLSDIERVRLERDLSQVIHHRMDQVMLIDLGKNEGGIRNGVVVLGVALPEGNDGMLVV